MTVLCRGCLKQHLTGFTMPNKDILIIGNEFCGLCYNCRVIYERVKNHIIEGKEMNI